MIKPSFFLLPAALMLTSCTYVIRKDLMDSGVRDFSFADVTKNPELYRGKLFILGGIIVQTKLTEEGSLIEAIYVPVDWTGALKDLEMPTTRFLALYPKEADILDPVIYDRGKEITVAAVFDGMQQGKIEEMDYTFPFFRIQQIYLWPKKMPVLYAPYPGPYPYWGPGRYGRWGGYYYP
jgi:outer membrane lipoprotein